MVVIEMLPRGAAADAVLVAEISELVNRAYDVAEEGMWSRRIGRTTLAETREAIELGHLAIARLDGSLVGSIRISRLDDETSWFGALAVDPAHAGRGLGGRLVAFAEDRARAAGAGTMQLELLVPLGGHPHTDLLAAWYGRLGYRETERSDLVDLDPGSVPLLTAPCEVAVMQKRLVGGIRADSDAGSARVRHDAGAVTDSEQNPAGRGSRELVLRNDGGDELSPCPACGRQTRTVGRGTCAECWQAKTRDGEPALRPLPPRTLPLLGSLDDVPDWVWFALATALLGGLVKSALALAF